MTDTRHFPEELPYDLPNELKQIAQEALYEHLQRPSPPTDKHEYEADSRQVAWLTAWIAANLYDPTRGKTLEQWVRGCVRAALLAWYRTVWRWYRCEEPFAVDEETGEMWEPVDEESLAMLEAVLWWLDIEWAVGQLSEAQQAVVAMVYEGCTQTEMARRLGCSQASVSQRLRRIGEALRRLLGL
ncbi:MAG: sigma-70 family RNA polymerase sigma factor [Acidobacteria bacterium]|nr:MAG: sigma-70 family RNA polymerase sigma factor [Acidobacteriota bacterium]